MGIRVTARYLWNNAFSKVVLNAFVYVITSKSNHFHPMCQKRLLNATEKWVEMFLPQFRDFVSTFDSKGRFCKTIASVAFVDT